MPEFFFRKRSIAREHRKREIAPRALQLKIDHLFFVAGYLRAVAYARGSFFLRRKLIDIIIIGRYFGIVSQGEQTTMNSTEANKYRI